MFDAVFAVVFVLAPVLAPVLAGCWAWAREFWGVLSDRI